LTKLYMILDDGGARLQNLRLTLSVFDSAGAQVVVFTGVIFRLFTFTRRKLHLLKASAPADVGRVEVGQINVL